MDLPLKNHSSRFSLTANILIGFVNHLLFFSHSEIHFKILYIHISSGLTYMGLCSKNQTTRASPDANKIHQENPGSKKGLPALNTSFLEGTQFSKNNFSQSNVVKDAQNENAREQSKRLWKIFLGEHLAQEKCKTNQPVLVRKTEITSDYGTKWKWKPRITSWFLGVWPYKTELLTRSEKYKHQVIS